MLLQSATLGQKLRISLYHPIMHLIVALKPGHLIIDNSGDNTAVALRLVLNGSSGVPQVSLLGPQPVFFFYPLNQEDSFLTFPPYSSTLSSTSLCQMLIW